MTIVAGMLVVPLGDGDLQATEFGESIRFHSSGRVDERPVERVTRRR